MSYHIIFAYPLDILRAWDVSVLPASTETSKQSSRQAQAASEEPIWHVHSRQNGQHETHHEPDMEDMEDMCRKWSRFGRFGAANRQRPKRCWLQMARNWSSVTPVNCLPVRFSIVSVWPLKKKKQSMSPYVSLCGGFLHSFKILRGRLYSAPHQSVILILLISHVPARSALSHHKGQVASPEGRKWCRGCHVACSLEEYQTLEAAICSNHKGSHEA